MPHALAAAAVLASFAAAPFAWAHDYRVVAVNGVAAPEGQRLTLREHRLSGFGGCNEFEAAVRVSRPVIRWLEPLRSSGRPCPDPALRDAEQALISAVDGAVGFRFEQGGRHLRLIGRAPKTDVLAELVGE